MPGHAEANRLQEAAARRANWKRWGPYISDRQWGTVREDYSADGDCWSYLPFEHAHLRAYRWGEDGLLGFTDRECRLCFSIGLWNELDPILKERLFGLTGPEGNHGEDVKEQYFFLESTPTHSWCKALYKYPLTEFPYQRLRQENRARSRKDPEFELHDSGAFDSDRYADIEVEYAKAGPDDILIRISATNRGAEPCRLHLLPQLFFRNTWSWGSDQEEGLAKPQLDLSGESIVAKHATLGDFVLRWDRPSESEPPPQPLFTENETNFAALYGAQNSSPYVKDAFHRRVIDRDLGATNPLSSGTKAALWYLLHLPPGVPVTVRLRLQPLGQSADAAGVGRDFDEQFELRRREGEAFYRSILSANLTEDEHRVTRQALAGLLWSKKFYHYAVRDWIHGDPGQPPPPQERLRGRNRDWDHLFNRDLISLPDGWEYPWYAAWDLAFHMLVFARVDAEFAKEQLLLFLREWYMHPSGQIPAYEFAFGDVNPPVHAWACWRVYKMTGKRGERDVTFLKRCFHKLLINFTWWVNRKDIEGNNLFSGGFLGLDNIGVFDRSKPLPGGGTLEQADGTAWMAFYCATMLSIALELASHDAAYEDVASKFFEHYVAIDAAINRLGGAGLWDEEDGFYYDQLHLPGRSERLRIRSMVGIIPLFAVELLEEPVIERLPGFKKRMEWFLRHRLDLALHVLVGEHLGHEHRLLAIPSRDQLVRALRPILDESEFLSPYGVRSLSRAHRDTPFELHLDGESYRIGYEPGESETGLFGGNSNWRGPIWMPVNFLLIEALERYHHFYGDELVVECPTGSKRFMTLLEISRELSRRVSSLFLADGTGRRPCHGDDARFASDPHWRSLVLFHEYFHGETGLGLGASHQTGWTALVALLLHDLASHRPTRGG